VLGDLLARFEPGWEKLSVGGAFGRLAAAVPAFAGLAFDSLPAEGVELAVHPTSGQSPPDDLPRDLMTEQISG